jgi:hypothetical protein
MAANPVKPLEPTVVERMPTRTIHKRKPSRRVRDILSSFIDTLEDDEDDDANEATCNAVESSLDLPNYTAAMKTTAAASSEKDLEIYMYPPHGMPLTAEEAASRGNKPVLKLMKNIFGSKQAGRLWHQMLSHKLRELKYKQSSVDMCLYYKITKSALILVGVYVDDLLVTSNETILVDEFFDQMKAFDVKDLGVAAKFLGIKSEYEAPEDYSMSQRTMILNLIEQFGLKQSKPVGTPIADVVP